MTAAIAALSFNARYQKHWLHLKLLALLKKFKLAVTHLPHIREHRRFLCEAAGKINAPDSEALAHRRTGARCSNTTLASALVIGVFTVPLSRKSYG